MGKQKRNIPRNGTPRPRPKHHDWRGHETRAAREIRQECERLWLSDSDSDLPYYAPALRVDGWPLSATGHAGVDAILDMVWRQYP